VEVHAELLPEQKTTFVAAQVKKGRTVAMLGDGINDAPALSEATVGVAMGAGSDVARESADIVLIGNDLMTFVETVRIARNCRRIIFQNFYGTLIVDTIGIGLAAVGILNPLLAAFIHVTSELTFVLNSTRPLAPRQKEDVLETAATPKPHRGPETISGVLKAPAFGVMDKRVRGFGCCSGSLSERLYDVRLTYGAGLSLWSMPQTI
jgi:hypothetical protein